MITTPVREQSTSVRIRHVYPLPIIRQSRSPTAGDDGEEEEQEQSTPSRSPQSVRGRREPRGTRDSPFTPDDLDDDDMHGRLIGSPPEAFNGDRSQTSIFLAGFRRFMKFNKDARIAKDPIKKSAFFLSLIHSPEDWANNECDWLERVSKDPTVLQQGMTAWQELEQRFSNSFFDYAGKERAQAKILTGQLWMKNGNVDQYISDFEGTARQAGMNVNDPSNLLLFARGLPIKLAESCIDHEPHETFEQWAKAARIRQKAWLQKKRLRKARGVYF